MLRSLNFTVIRCDQCQETIKIQPGVAFESITHECKKAPVKDTAKEATTTRRRKPNASKKD
jgi:hypothetical protein